MAEALRRDLQRERPVLHALTEASPRLRMLALVLLVLALLGLLMLWLFQSALLPRQSEQESGSGSMLEPARGNFSALSFDQEITLITGC